MPTVAELVKKKLGLKKLAAVKDNMQETVGNLTMSDVKSIAKEKFGDDSASNVKMILGTCKSCGVVVEGKSAKEVVKEVK